jgi:hypothetical protein
MTLSCRILQVDVWLVDDKGNESMLVSLKDHCVPFASVLYKSNSLLCSFLGRLSDRLRRF